MTAPAITIADAVVAALNAATLSQSVTFERVWVPKFDIENSADIQGKVAPASDTREMESAARDKATIAIDVGVVYRLAGAVASEVAEVDALVELCEELKPLLNRHSIGGAIGSAAPAQNPIVSVEDLDGKRTVLVVVRFTFDTTVAI